MFTCVFIGRCPGGGCRAVPVQTRRPQPAVYLQAPEALFEGPGRWVTPAIRSSGFISRCPHMGRSGHFGSRRGGDPGVRGQGGGHRGVLGERSRAERSRYRDARDSRRSAPQSSALANEVRLVVYIIPVGI